MNGIAVGVVSFVLWVLPILLVAYVIRALHLIIEGMRSVNVGVQRIAAAVEELVDAERGRGS